MFGRRICLQIGDIRTVLLDVPEGGKTTRISLPEPYKNLPLKAERVDDNYKKPKTSDDMWPCFLTGWNPQKVKQDESHPQIFNDTQPAQVSSNQPAKEESEQPTLADSNQPTQVQSDPKAQAQFSLSNLVRSNQPIEMQLSQPPQMQSDQPEQVQFYEKNPAKTDVEPTKINAKLTIV